MTRVEQTGMEPPRREPVDRLSRPEGSAESSREQPARAVPPDRATFSDEGRLMDRLRRAVDEGSDLREDRVRELQQSIQQGSYRPDSREIARLMLAAEEASLASDD